MANKKLMWVAVSLLDNTGERMLLLVDDALK